MGREVYEFVKQVDYNQYYESMAGATIDGKTQQRYFDFSLNSARAAQVRCWDGWEGAQQQQRVCTSACADRAPPADVVWRRSSCGSLWRSCRRSSATRPCKA